MSRLLIVDRMEQGRAVCETEAREQVVLLQSQLPEGVREGDCLRECADGYVLDAAETERRRARNRARFRSLLAGEE